MTGEAGTTNRKFANYVRLEQSRMERAMGIEPT